MYWYMEQMVTECDLTDRKYDEAVEGFAVCVPGATGRVCQVLHGGPEELARVTADGEKVWDYDDLLAELEKYPEYYPDL